MAKASKPAPAARSRRSGLSVGTGRPLPSAAPGLEMGVAGTVIYGGRIQSVERSSEWIGLQRWKTASDIVTNVSIVAASIHYFLNMIAHPQWTVVPPNDSSEATDLAEFTDKALKGMETPWSQVVRKAGMYRFNGFGIQEWTVKKNEKGQIVFKDIETRPAHTIEEWEMTPEGNVLGMWQRAPMTGEMLGIPRAKVLYLVEDTLTDSPEGLGILRHLAEPYNRLRTFLALETLAFERDLRGIPIGRAPLTLINRLVKEKNLSQAQADAMVAGMKDFVSAEIKKVDTGMLLDSMPYESMAQDGVKVGNVMQWGLELLTGSSNGLPDLANAVNRLQREMARIIGTEQLMMGDEGGNRALSIDKSRNLYLVSNAVLGNICQTCDRDLVGVLWALNNFPQELRPKLKTEDVAFKDVVEIANTLKDMALAGAVLAPDDPVIDDVRTLLGVSPARLMTPEELGQMRSTASGKETSDEETPDKETPDDQEDGEK